jgi:hypothetical protein
MGYELNAMKSKRIDFEVIGEQDESPTVWRSKEMKDPHVLIRTKDGCHLHWVRREFLDAMMDCTELPAPPQACA